MRLIDADEVKKYIHDLMLNNADRYTDKEMAQYDNLIDSCQTVEAIPIEFLKKQAQKAIGFSEGGNDSVRVKNGMLEVVSGYIFAKTVATIIEEWRNENGKTD